MHADQIQITLSRDKLHEIVTAYNVLSNFLDSVFPRELLYKKPFLQGLDSALKEVKSRQSQKVQSFDEFTK